jgi:hypothetical protein
MDELWGGGPDPLDPPLSTPLALTIISKDIELWME